MSSSPFNLPWFVRQVNQATGLEGFSQSIARSTVSCKYSPSISYSAKHGAELQNKLWSRNDLKDTFMSSYLPTTTMFRALWKVLGQKVNIKIYDTLEMVLEFLLLYLGVFFRETYRTFSCHLSFWARLQWLWSHAFSTSQETLGHGSRSHVPCLAHGAS